MTFPLLRDRLTAQSSGLYKYHAGDVFTPGVMNMVFESRLSLPSISGNGRFHGQSPAAFQPPQMYAQRAVTRAGLGGIVPGQLYTQGLSE